MAANECRFDVLHLWQKLTNRENCINTKSKKHKQALMLN